VAPALLFHRLRCHFRLLRPRPQVRFVRRQRRLVPLRRRARQRDTQRGGDRGGDFVLHREDVAQLPVIPLTPYVPAVGGGNQLGRDAQPLSRAPDTTLEHMGDIQRLRDPPDIFLFTAERESRAPRYHLQAGDARQQVDDLFGQAVAEVLLLL